MEEIKHTIYILNKYASSTCVCVMLGRGSEDILLPFDRGLILRYPISTTVLP